MITGFDVGVELAAALCAVCFAFGALAGHGLAQSKPIARRNPLTDLMEPAKLSEAISLAARRNARRTALQAVLRGRIDQLAALDDLASPQDREQLHDQIAEVMRAGLRRGDRVADLVGEGFTIIIPGADEPAAAGIADRLRASLVRLRVRQPGGLSPRFGVAAGHRNDCGNLLMQRARRALDAAQAQAQGHDRVVTASAFEEVLYLPAPTHDAQPAAAAG